MAPGDESPHRQQQQQQQSLNLVPSPAPTPPLHALQEVKYGLLYHHLYPITSHTQPPLPLHTPLSFHPNHIIEYIYTDAKSVIH
ncbi:hypothetical protein E2C01_006732 [Portunus trituberculatus]|uniref:Uncharacterized protein n=1 Tax=Portunus trituberculatus TaxID=210409 RepID=A0A5B7CVW2_PORTR|nr:hypothetical protein [Portunus trituberculatus]